MAAADEQSLDSMETLSERQREAVQTELFQLADDELVLADRYTEWQVRAPTIESDLAIANIAQDELGHARLWYDLLEDFGYSESDLIWERDGSDFKHATLVELPFGDGDWADCIVRGYFYDTAEHLRLNALADSSFEPLANRVGKVLDEEDYHIEHARSWLQRVATSDESRERIQDTVDRLFPYALALFEPGDEAVEAAVVEEGIRSEPLAELREEWHDQVSEFLESIGVGVSQLDFPEQYDTHVSPDNLPDHLGRDGDHTEHWDVLFAEMTNAYRELDRTSTAHFMQDPADE
ncbi:ring-1,2-phenylacetyl-CoA epoxidase subunit PaaC [Halogranum amylolyticum]|uniref:Ring-1,2-phenylacetyl-CoA epoxidase subunit PaaC n=1 Tax=Halogranum amylolyticum TaxID=660520 RepID=A0A1H8WR40_9EURY|nr:1,2-phenylacetyl-CoA epoxidase subunit PaaC [Halogranum amylolyticum]SEP30076.1 ring-1,2-phenylacetyl-CoA epoxidase subunit PaaC [Halogranum amylolyticum]